MAASPPAVSWAAANRRRLARHGLAAHRGALCFGQPHFDAFVVGSQPRDRLFPGKAAAEPLAPLPAGRRRALEVQAGRIGEILEARPRLVVGTVTVGAHA